MKKISILCCLLAVLTAIFTVNTVKIDARADEVVFGSSRSALLLDSESGTIVYEKNSNDRRQIASMVKIMTLNLIFEEVEAGNVSLDEGINVSEYATSMGGSQAFLDAHCSYKAEELVKSIIVASANDSCVAMAERISGEVGAFVQRMNEKASEWGMDNTNFVNCTGLPAPNQYSCAKDVSIMMRKLLKHEKFFEYAKVWMFDFIHPSGRKTELSNTNKLVRFYNGCDGGKTGFTQEAMSCLSATAKRGDTRLVCVVMGSPDAKSRNAEVSKLLDYGFANYESKTFLRGGEELSDEVKVEGGKSNSTLGVVESNLSAFTKRGENKDFEVIT